ASPRFRAPVTASMIASRARPASALDRPALSATWSINSLLFTGMEELLVGGSCPLMKPGLPAVHRDLPGRWKSSRWVILRAAHLEFDHDPRLRSDPVPAPEPGEGTMDQCLTRVCRVGLPLPRTTGLRLPSTRAVDGGGTTGRSSARSSTSSIHFTGTMRMLSVTFFGI